MGSFRISLQSLLLSKLHDVLFGAVHQSIPVNSEVLIVPHRELWSVPWGALIYDEASPATSGLGRRFKRCFMIAKHPLRMAPSLLIAETLATCGEESSTPGRTALVMASNPNGNCPWTVEEGKYVCGVLSHLAGYTVASHANEDAKSSTLLSAAQDIDWFHFAGKISGQKIILQNEETLSAEEILENVRLRKGSVAILSACDGARQTLDKGQQMTNMMRAFLKSGAACAVGSLWKVEDAHTFKLMK
jgi:hypothetical protein